MGMKGRVVYQFAFDISAEIRTSDIREILHEKPSPLEIRVGTTVPKDVPIYRPLTISLKSEEMATSVGRAQIRPLVKVLDIGVVSISYEIPFTVASVTDLLPYHQLQVKGRPLAGEAETLCAQVRENLRPFLVKAHDERQPAEAYTVFCFEEVESSSRPVSEWARESRADIARLLVEESGKEALAADQVGESHSQSLSYTEGDLAIVDWDAALLVDRGGYFDDVLYVIELANIQLEEFRLFDNRLDRQFLAAYDDLDRFYKVRWWRPTPDKILNTLRSFRMDVTKMSEEVTNITKFVGDWYLARVYLACKGRFHLAHWEATVDQKLKQLDELYSLVHQEISGRRMLLLEAIIVALFIFDVLVVLLLKK